jgi:hypothetical protein
MPVIPLIDRSQDQRDAEIAEVEISAYKQGIVHYVRLFKLSFNPVLAARCAEQRIPVVVATSSELPHELTPIPTLIVGLTQATERVWMMRIIGHPSVLCRRY